MNSATPSWRTRVGGWLIYAIAFLLAVGVAKNYTYTGSFDLALHYDLVHSIYHHWGWPTFYPLASDMQGYPPLAHYLGALAGLIVGSPMLGMNTVAMAAMFGCYVLLMRTVSAGAIASTAAAAVIVAVGLFLGRTQHAVEGFQTIYNYFYAQMVGDCLFLAYALWLSRTGLDWKRRLTITAVVTFILGWLYLVTSIQVALTYICMEGLLFLRAALAQRSFRPTQLLPTALGAVILPLLIRFHPKFALMATVAVNDGSLPLGLLEPYVPAISAALVLLALLLGVVVPDTPRWRKATLFLAVAGAASGAAAITQFLAFALFKAGSAYAIKKYGFANVTLLIFSVAALAGVAIEGRRQLRDRPIFVAVVSCAAGALALWLLPVSNTPDRVDRFAKYQRKAMQILALPAVPASARHHIVSKNPDFHAQLNHAETMVDLAMDPNTSLVADSTDLSNANPATWAFMTDPSMAFPKPCVVPGSRFGFMVLAKLDCVRDWPLAPQSPLNLSKMKFLPASFSSGWSGNEGNGVWTLGKQAVYKLHLDNPPPTIRLTFSGPAFIPTKTYVQHVQAYVGDVLVGEHVYTADKPDGDLTAIIPASLLKDGRADVVLKLPDATSPADQKLSGDVRVIAVFVTGVSLDK